jgi:hypothetical protein
MIIVRAGAFLMGSPEGEGEDNERPQANGRHRLLSFDRLL